MAAPDSGILALLSSYLNKINKKVDGVFDRTKYQPMVYDNLQSLNISPTFETVLNYVGKGYVDCIVACLPACAPAGTGRLKITIDNIVVYDGMVYAYAQPQVIGMTTPEYMNLNVDNYISFIGRMKYYNSGLKYTGILTSYPESTIFSNYPYTGGGNNVLALHTGPILFSTSLKVEIYGFVDDQSVARRQHGSVIVRGGKMV